ncbi:MAG: hypothetical protein JO304_09855, partial [Solirubrobacterales bacterium]|nr:hypothetical protein [Solirubrobacterales bacterium]
MVGADGGAGRAVACDARGGAVRAVACDANVRAVRAVAFVTVPARIRVAVALAAWALAVV